MTKINKLHFNGVDYDIGDKDIHDLTEKTEISPNDEFILSDSENIRQNKKIKGGDLLGIGNTRAIESISKGDILKLYSLPTEAQSTKFTGVGFSSNVQKISIARIGNGEEINSIDLILAKVGTPTNDLSVRIETDNSGHPSGSLVDANSYGTISQSSLTTTLTKYTISFNGSFTIPGGLLCHIVLGMNAVDNTNFYKIGGKVNGTDKLELLQFDGLNWNSYVNYSDFIKLGNLTQTQQVNVGYSTPRGMWMSKDGKHIATTSTGSSFVIRPISTARDLSTRGTATVKSGLSDRSDIRISEDGKKYILGTYSTDTLYYGTMTTARDASTASSTSFNASSSWGIYYKYQGGLFMKPDGTKLFLLGGSSGNLVYEITLSTPFDITTGTKTGQATVPIRPYVIRFSDDGKKVFFSTQDGTRKIYEYNLTIARDITTFTETGSTSSQGLGKYKQLGYIVNLSAYSYLFTFDSNNQEFTLYSAENPEGENISIYSDSAGFEENFTGKANAINGVPKVITCSINDFNIGEIVKYRTDVLCGQENLLIGNRYHLSDTPGEISLTPGTIICEVGMAIEPTILKLRQTY